VRIVERNLERKAERVIGRKVKMSISFGNCFKCPKCQSVGQNEIRRFNDDGVECVVFNCVCGHEEVLR
jgi:RNase P subunit RPR2